MRKIIVPTDFSENAQNALRYACEVFKYERSEFILMHAFADEVYESHLNVSRDLFEEYREKVKESSLKELQSIIAEMEENPCNPRHIFTSEAVFAPLVDAVNELADRENADVVVMGTKGETDDRNITFGSNTLQVVKYVASPVLAIPSNYTDWHPEHIVFATDYSMPFRKRELKLVSTLAKSFAATLHFVHVSSFESLSFRQQDNKSFLESCLDENKLEFHTLVGKEVIQTVEKFVAEKQADMLIMVNHRHSVLEDIFFSNTIDTLGLKMKIPFLILQNLPR